MLGAFAARGPAVAVSALALAGCISLVGPCQFAVERQAQGSRASVQCEAGGTVDMLAPGAAIEAAGHAASEVAR
jgi:hypothetical protein